MLWFVYVTLCLVSAGDVQWLVYIILCSVSAGDGQWFVYVILCLASAGDGQWSNVCMEGGLVNSCPNNSGEG